MIMQYDETTNNTRQVNNPTRTLKLLNLYTGMSIKQIYSEVQEKISILKWMTSKNIADINKIGLIMSDYYTEKEELMKLVRNNLGYDINR